LVKEIVKAEHIPIVYGKIFFEKIVKRKRHGITQCGAKRAITSYFNQRPPSRVFYCITAKAQKTAF